LIRDVGLQRRLSLLRPLQGAAVVSASMWLIVLYLLPHALRSLHLPLGLDAPVYIWSARYAGAIGLDAPGLIPRPAAFALVDLIARSTGVPHALIVAALIAVAATMAALATAAVASLISRRTSTALVIVVLLVTGAYLTRTAGYLSATLSLALVAASLWGVLQWWNSMTLRRGLGPVAFLVVAGLSNIAYFALFVGVFIVGSILSIPLSRGSTQESGSRRLGGILLGSLIAVVLVTALLGLTSSSAPVIDTSADGFIRRVMGTSALTASFRAQLAGAVMGFLFWGTLAAFAVASVRLELAPEGRAGFTWSVLLAWVGSIAAAAGGLLVGLPMPVHRLMWSALPVAIVIGLGAYALAFDVTKEDTEENRWPLSLPRELLSSVPVLIVLGLTLLQWWGWRNFSPSASRSQIRAVEVMANVHAATPTGTPLILVADDGPAEMTGNLNWLRAAVPGERISEVIGYPGGYHDFMRGSSPTVPAEAEPRDVRFAEAAWSQVDAALDRPYIAMAANSLDQEVFAAAKEDRRTTELAPGVLLLRQGGFPPGTSVGDEAVPPDPLAFEPYQPFLVAPLVLLSLALLGWGWVRWFFPSRPFLERLLISSTAGFTVLAVAAIALDLLGVHLADGGATGAVLSTALGGAALWVAASRGLGWR
jgi:hypothetical protein